MKTLSTPTVYTASLGEKSIMHMKPVYMVYGPPQTADLENDIYCDVPGLPCLSKIRVSSSVVISL